MQAVKMTTEAAAKIFFTSSHFAVVGASSDPTKFGHKSELILIPFT
jgi:predicted CoA-binding protein